MIDSEAVVAAARAAGFDAAGICSAQLPTPARETFQSWIDRRCHSGMAYLEQTAHLRASGIAALLTGARSVVALALSYNQPGHTPTGDVRIARYALAKDYHRVVRQRLVRLLRSIDIADRPAEARVLVDTAPVLERAYATSAGLGWIGKSGLLVSRQLGSYTVLGLVALTAQLTPRPAFETSPQDGCGDCDSCMEACPGGAILEPRRVDAGRCLSYWTIEHQGEFGDQTPRLGACLFGCDRCQEVCPLNRSASPLTEPRLRARPQLASLTAEKIAAMTDSSLRSIIAGTPVRRAGVAGLRRNLERLLTERGLR